MHTVQCVLGVDVNTRLSSVLEAVGFKKVCRVPQMGYFARKDRFMDGYIVLAIPNNKEGD